jgi:hypothetical protein
VILNKIFNEKCVEQLAWRGYEEYRRIILESDPTISLRAFDQLTDKLREAWISAADRILELAILEVKHKLEN